MDQLRDKIRVKHYAKSTEKLYVYWILQYICFHRKHHPAQDCYPIAAVSHIERQASRKADKG
ncbi:phage integrase N-terminal SAM-like domain-containing protein [Verrucomicrobiota bacterium]